MSPWVPRSLDVCFLTYLSTSKGKQNLGTICIASWGWRRAHTAWPLRLDPTLSPRETDPGRRGARAQHAYLVPEVWGELPQDEGICRESRPLSSGPQAHLPSPPHSSDALPHSPSCREAGQAASKNQSNMAGGPPLWDRKGLNGSMNLLLYVWLCLWCLPMCVIVCACVICAAVCMIPKGMW